MDDYVVHYLQALREIANRLVFVSTSSIPEDTISDLENLCDQVILKANEGYDFASWREAVTSEILEDFDELVLCNDSVYGPLFPLRKVFDKMKGRNCDFWGITGSHDIAYHVQSYFLVFRKPVLASRLFREFWETMQTLQSKAEVIRSYEVGLSQTLLRAGFRALTYSRYRHMLSHAIFDHCATILYYLRSHAMKNRQAAKRFKNLLLHPTLMPALLRTAISHIREIFHLRSKITSLNPTHFFWRQLILYSHAPFIKVELLRDNPMNVSIVAYERTIRRVSDYEIRMIASHLGRVRKGSPGTRGIAGPAPSESAKTKL